MTFVLFSIELHIGNIKIQILIYSFCCSYDLNRPWSGMILSNIFHKQLYIYFFSTSLNFDVFLFIV